MSVPKGERKESKQNFDALYYRVHDDAEDMILNRFHASKEIAEANQGYIREAARELRRLVWNLIYHIKVANALFPTTAEELTERRIHQEEAIGSCFDILTLYELVMHKLRVYEELFPDHEVHVRQLRRDVLNDIWKENIYEILGRGRNRTYSGRKRSEGHYRR